MAEEQFKYLYLMDQKAYSPVEDSRALLKRLRKGEPEFLTEIHDPTAIEPLHPEAVLWVSLNAPPSSLSVMGRFLDLPLALNFVVAEFRAGRCLAFTVLVDGDTIFHDGLLPLSGKILKGLSLEIIGLNRGVVTLARSVFTMSVQLTLQSLTLLDTRSGGVSNCSLLAYHSDFHLIDVKISGSQEFFLKAHGDGCRVECDRVVISKSLIAFVVEKEAHVLLNDCKVSDLSESGGVLSTGGVFMAQNSRFLKCSVLQMRTKSRATFSNCVFDSFCRSGVGFSSSASVAEKLKLAQILKFGFYCAEESELTVKKSSASGYVRFADLTSSCRLYMEGCRVSKTREFIHIFENCDARVSDCVVDASDFVCIICDAEGKVVFEKNRLEGSCRVPRILLDEKSVMPEHDFRRVKVIRKPISGAEFSPLRPMSEVSKATKVMKDDIAANGWTWENIKKVYKDDCGYKFCTKCQVQEDVEGAKMKYCEGCKCACYCSKECQKAHWRDHKLLCKELAQKYK